MGIFDLFASKKHLLDLSFISTDIHSHILPGIDDGAKDLDESIALVRGLKSIGIKKIIATPHISTEHYNNTPEQIETTYNTLRTALSHHNISIDIEYAAEYLIDYDFERRLDTEQLLTFGNNYILVELPYFQYPQNFFNIIFKLRLAGYKPILAHPERYPYWNNNAGIYTELKDKEILLQVNILSFVGYYDIFAQKNAVKLLDLNCIGFLATDIHSPLFFEYLPKLLKNKFLNNANLQQNIRNKMF